MSSILFRRTIIGGQQHSPQCHHHHRRHLVGLSSCTRCIARSMKASSIASSSHGQTTSSFSSSPVSIGSKVNNVNYNRSAMFVDRRYNSSSSGSSAAAASAPSAGNNNTANNISNSMDDNIDSKDNSCNTGLETEFRGDADSVAGGGYGDGDDAAVEIVDNTIEAMIADRSRTMLEMKKERERDLLVAPRHPHQLQAPFYRIKRSQKLLRTLCAETSDATVITKVENALELPPMKQHPWVEQQPSGRFIRHGDGQQQIHNGTGEVGFGDFSRYFPSVAAAGTFPEHWKSFKYHPVAGLAPPDRNGFITPGAVIKRSLKLTGHGMFATRKIKKGEAIMVVRSAATDLGYNSKIDRLRAMTTQVIRKAYDGTQEDRNALHQWVLTGQTSARIEHWPATLTHAIIADIGGPEVLESLELHPLSIAKIASVIEMNSFVVEGFYNEDKGMGYWPEASWFNHSCCANCDYDIKPVDEFLASEFSPDKQKREEAERKLQEKEAEEDRLKNTRRNIDNTEIPEEDRGRSLPDIARMLRGVLAGEDTAAMRREYENYQRWQARASVLDPLTGHQPGQEFRDGAKPLPLMRKTAPGNPKPSMVLADIDPEMLADEYKQQKSGSGGDSAESDEVADADASRVGGSTPSADAIALANTLEEGEGESTGADASTTALSLPTDEYVFCCRANRDIDQGEEMLIAYVPPEWRHADRQRILHERYRFWCRCPKCVVVIDSNAKRVGRAAFVVMMFYIVCQTVLYGLQGQALDQMDAIDSMAGSGPMAAQAQEDASAQLNGKKFHTS